MRYDAPGFLENIEPRFNWIDPAEVSWSNYLIIISKLTE